MNARLGRLLTPHGSRALDAVVVGGLFVAAAVAFGYPVAAAVNQPVLVTQRTGAQIALAC